jgi:hypothetical protein
MESLYELHTTTEVFMPDTLAALAALPHLETLSIYPTTRGFQASKPAPKKSFRALQNFALCSAPYSLFADVWSLQCFNHLVSLKLTFVTRHDSEEEEKAWAVSLMTLVRDNSPNLAELIVNFDRDFACEHSVDIGHQSVLEPMKELPLENLELFSARLSAPEHYDVKIHCLIPVVWSQVTVLNLPSEPGTPKKLYWFSKLLRLEHLTLHLQLATPLPEIPPISRQTNMCFNTLESSKRVDVTGDTHQIARWVFSAFSRFFLGLKSACISVGSSPYGQRSGQRIKRYDYASSRAQRDKTTSFP